MKMSSDATKWIKFAILGTILCFASQLAAAGECACEQHDAKANGPDACSLTESKSYCTISFGASGNARTRLTQALSSGEFPGATLPSSGQLRPLIGNAEDPLDVSFRLISILGRTDINLNQFLPDAPQAFATALMLNFGMSAVQIDEKSFFSSMQAYFKRDHRRDDELILKAFTQADSKTEVKFDNTNLRVKYRCALLTYSEVHSVVVAGEGAASTCRSGSF
jgi:hypothetical protein